MENITALDQLKFPIGAFVKQDEYSAGQLSTMIEDIAGAASLYKKLAQSLRPEDLLKTYRPGSWNVQQLIHHVADIQLLHFLRMKRAITEPDYKEVTLINMDGWAHTKDGIAAPVDDSILMLEGITRRYVYLISSLSDDEFKIAYYHPVRSLYFNQIQAVAMSNWHLKHHLAHINLALKGI